jgi:predicted component of type VI protein secretion system
MVIQVIFRDPRSGTEQKYEFDQSPIRIGRNPLNNIVLEGNFVSGWHGIIRFDESGTYYFDLGSTNGTCLAGSRLPKNTPVPITQTTLLTIWMFELTITPSVVGQPAGTRKPPARPFPVETLVGTARATDVFKASVVPEAAPNLSHSQVPHSHPTPPPPTAPASPYAAPSPVVSASQAIGSHVVSASQISPSRIVAAGARSATSAPPSSAVRTPSQVIPPKAASEQSSARLLRCLRIIGAFADAFMGLKKGYEQFGSEVGVRPLRGTTRLHRARTSQEVIEYVLDPATDPEACARDLNAVFADMGIHDLALIEGISQSVRGLLAKLDPNAFDMKASASLWSGGKAKAKWSSYVDTFNNLLGEDSVLHAEIFGEEFAVGYASVARGNEGDEGDEGAPGLGFDDDRDGEPNA